MKLTIRQIEDFRRFIYTHIIVEGIKVNLIFLVTLLICSIGAFVLACLVETAAAFYIVSVFAVICSIPYMGKIFYSTSVLRKIQSGVFGIFYGTVEAVYTDSVVVDGYKTCADENKHAYIGQKRFVIHVPFRALQDFRYSASL